MTDEERIGRARELLEPSIAPMCREIGAEFKRDLQWDGWGAEALFVRLDGERREAPVPADWLTDYPEASEGYQTALRRRIRQEIRALCAVSPPYEPIGRRHS